MPPKKRAAGVKVSAEDAEIDAKLAAIDLLVQEMRSQLEEAMEPAREEMRKEVALFLMRLPTRVKSMRMGDFLRECGGDVALLLDKERKATKLARTTAKGAFAGAGAKPVPRFGRAVTAAPSTGAAAMEVEGRAGAGGAGGGAGAEEGAAAGEGGGGSGWGFHEPVTGGAGAGSSMQLPAPLAARTPSLALMRSSSALPMAAGARTPGAVGFSTFLPKTPAPMGADGAMRKPRVQRRNELVYHVILSENGSPLAVPNAGGGAGAAAAAAAQGAGMTAASVVQPLAEGSSMHHIASSIVEGGVAGAGAALALQDPDAMMEAAAADPTRAAEVEAALEALAENVRMLQERLAAQKAAAAAAAGGVVPASAVKAAARPAVPSAGVGPRTALRPKGGARTASAAATPRAVPQK